MREPQTAKLKPCPGRRVRDPITKQVLRDEGEDKPLNSYWGRRLLDGDVEPVMTEPQIEEKE